MRDLATGKISSFFLLALLATFFFGVRAATAGQSCLGCQSGICCTYDNVTCNDDPTPRYCGTSYCGVVSDSCGNTFDCGGCTYAGDVCHAEYNLCCGSDQRVYQYNCCTPKQTCASLGVTCGTIDSGWNTCGQITCGPPCGVPKSVPASSPPMTALLGGMMAAIGAFFVRRNFRSRG